MQTEVWKRREQVRSRITSRTRLSCFGCHDCIRTPIGAWQDSPESSRSLLSNRSGLIPKIHLSAWKITKQAASVFSQANLGFYAVGPKSKSCTPPTKARTTRTPPKLHIWPAAALEQVGVCLD